MATHMTMRMGPRVDKAPKMMGAILLPGECCIPAGAAEQPGPFSCQHSVHARRNGCNHTNLCKLSTVRSAQSFMSPNHEWTRATNNKQQSWFITSLFCLRYGSPDLKIK